MLRAWLALACVLAVISLFAPPAVRAEEETTIAATSCPAGQTYVKGYTKSDGTKVAGYCRASTSSSAMMSSKCPSGQTYVKGYTKADGTKVQGYCRTASGSH